jgi:hypothetical protein
MDARELILNFLSFFRKKNSKGERKNLRERINIKIRFNHQLNIHPFLLPF